MYGYARGERDSTLLTWTDGNITELYGYYYTDGATATPTRDHNHVDYFTGHSGYQLLNALQLSGNPLLHHFKGLLTRNHPKKITQYDEQGQLLWEDNVYATFDAQDRLTAQTDSFWNPVDNRSLFHKDVTLKYRCK